jgi:DNA-3-methyladenine glycosylase
MPKPFSMASASSSALPHAFFERPVLVVARELIGCVLVHGRTAGLIVETEAYHDSEPACHAYRGLTERTSTLFGPPGFAYVYRSYGIHALFNVVCEPEGVGAAVLVRALQPLRGLELMRARRGLADERALCSGPGKLTQALAIELSANRSDLSCGPLRLLERAPGASSPQIATGPRVGITKAAELPWRFVLAGSPYISRPAGRSEQARLLA